MALVSQADSNALQDRLQRTAASVVSLAESHRPDETTAAANAQEPPRNMNAQRTQESMRMLADMLRQAVSLLQHPQTGLLDSLSRTVMARSGVEHKLHAAERVVATLRALITIHEHLIASDSRARSGALAAAVDALLSGEALLNRLAETACVEAEAAASATPSHTADGAPAPSAASHSRVLKALRESVAMRWAPLRVMAKAKFQQALHVEGRALTLGGCTRSELASIAVLCDRCGVLAECAAELCRDIRERLLGPLLLHPAYPAPLTAADATLSMGKDEGDDDAWSLVVELQPREQLCQLIAVQQLHGSHLLPGDDDEGGQLGERGHEVENSLGSGVTGAPAAHARSAQASRAIRLTRGISTLGRFLATHVLGTPDDDEGDCGVEERGAASALRSLLGSCLWFGEEFCASLEAVGPFSYASAAAAAAGPAEWDSRPGGTAHAATVVSAFASRLLPAAYEKVLQDVLFPGGRREGLGAHQPWEPAAPIGSNAAGDVLLGGPGGGGGGIAAGLAETLTSLLFAGMPSSPASYPAYVASVLAPAAEVEAQLYRRGMLIDALLPSPSGPEDPTPPRLRGRRILFSLLEHAEPWFAHTLRARVLEEARSTIIGAGGSHHGRGYGSCASIVVDDTTVELRLRATQQHAGVINDSTGSGSSRGASSPPPLAQLLAEAYARGAPAAQQPSPGVPGGLSSLLSQPRCQVTVVAHTLLSLAVDVLESAVAPGTPPATRAALCAAARDVFDLFRALVPFRFGRLIDSLPRLAMLLHNDCAFLAHAAMMLGLVYRPRLAHAVAVGREGAPDAPPASDSPLLALSFLDLIPALQSLGQSAFVGELRRQRAAVVACLEAPNAPPLEAAGSGATWGAPPDQEGDEGVVVVVGHPALGGAVRLGVDEALGLALRRQTHVLRSAAADWGDVLPAVVYSRAVGHLGDVALHRSCGAIVTLTAISEPASRVLSSLLVTQCRAIEAAVAAWDVPAPPAPSAPPSQDKPSLLYSRLDAASAAAPPPAPLLPRECVRHWHRAVVLAEVLDASLAAITQRVQQGVYAESVSTTELVSLVRALFQPSPARSALIRLVSGVA